MTTEFSTIGLVQLKGHSSNVIDFRYSEDSTPNYPGDESGAVGELRLEVLGSDDGLDVLLYRDEFVLRDGNYGALFGTITTVDANDNVLSLAAIGRLSRLNAEVTFGPLVTDIFGVFERIFQVANISDNVVFAPNIMNRSVNLPGFTGNLWTFTKQVCAVFQVEIAFVGNAIVIKPIRETEIFLESFSSVSYRVSEFQPAQRYDVAYYDYEFLTDALAFPKGGWTPEVQVYSVEANETVVFDIAVDAYLTSIKQPQVLDFVPVEYAGPDSVYSVSGNDGLPISAQFWRDFGGDMKVSLKENGTVIEVELTGPDEDAFSPYSIAVSDGATKYSTLRLIGTGMFFDKKSRTFETKVSPGVALDVEGQTIDYPIVDTLQDATYAGIIARRRYALPVQGIEVSGRQFFRAIQTGDFTYFVLNDDPLGRLDGDGVLGIVEDPALIPASLTFNEYNNTLPAGYTFSDFDQVYGAATFENFNDSVSTPLRQSFGTLVGARTKYNDAYYRVRSASFTQDDVRFEAEYDTTFGDFNNTFVLEEMAI